MYDRIGPCAERENANERVRFRQWPFTNKELAMTNEKFTVSAMISAPVGRVWQAYTTPADITQWNFANDAWCCPSAAVDLQVGGTYNARMEAKDGSFGFDLISRPCTTKSSRTGL